MYRHLNSHHAGEYFDQESGLTHLAHAACNLIFLMELEDNVYAAKLIKDMFGGVSPTREEGDVG